MDEVLTPSGLEGLQPGQHVCWIVNEPATFVEQAAAVLSPAPEFSQKAIAFGPQGSQSLVELVPSAKAAIDPGAAIQGSGELDPRKVFALFREQTEIAHAEGYRGVRVVADMDWVAAAVPNTDLMVSFELMLGPLAKELEASIVCAYRKTFDADVVTAVPSVHETDVGGEEPPQFKIFADSVSTWRLSGEVDLAVSSTFETAIAQVAGTGDCLIDVSALEYIDVAGMRQIAQAARASTQPMRLIGVPPMLRRIWNLAGFDETVPTVELVDRNGPG